MKYTSTLLLASFLALAPAPFYPLLAADNSFEGIADAYQLKLADSAGNLPYYVVKSHGRTPHAALCCAQRVVCVAVNPIKAPRLSGA